MNMEDLRKISFEFRRVSSDMLNSITDDNNVYLIKFREFIDDNKIIKDYEIKFNEDCCNEKFFNKKYDLKDIYEAGLYKKSAFRDIRKRLQNNNVKIYKTL